MSTNPSIYFKMERSCSEFWKSSFFLNSRRVFNEVACICMCACRRKFPNLSFLRSNWDDLEAKFITLNLKSPWSWSNLSAWHLSPLVPEITIILNWIRTAAYHYFFWTFVGLLGKQFFYQMGTPRHLNAYPLFSIFSNLGFQSISLPIFS